MPSRDGRLYKHEIKELIEMYKSEIPRLIKLIKTAPICYKNHYCYIGQRAVQKIKSPDNRVKHHWSYNEEDAMDIIYLTTEYHGAFHSHSSYDKNEKKYRTSGGKLLDTKFKHMRYIVSINMYIEEEKERWKNILEKQETI